MLFDLPIRYVCIYFLVRMYSNWYVLYIQLLPAVISLFVSFLEMPLFSISVI
jgi:hypothetical protein